MSFKIRSYLGSIRVVIMIKNGGGERYLSLVTKETNLAKTILNITHDISEVCLNI
jgi:hypothetical protein